MIFSPLRRYVFSLTQRTLRLVETVEIGIVADDAIIGRHIKVDRNARSIREAERCYFYFSFARATAPAYSSQPRRENDFQRRSSAVVNIEKNEEARDMSAEKIVKVG